MPLLPLLLLLLLLLLALLLPLLVPHSAKTLASVHLCEGASLPLFSTDDAAALALGCCRPLGHEAAHLLAVLSVLNRCSLGIVCWVLCAPRSRVG